jgi:hypothetical protein
MPTPWGKHKVSALWQRENPAVNKKSYLSANTTPQFPFLTFTPWKESNILWVKKNIYAARN